MIQMISLMLNSLEWESFFLPAHIFLSDTYLVFKWRPKKILNFLILRDESDAHSEFQWSLD